MDVTQITENLHEELLGIKERAVVVTNERGAIYRTNTVPSQAATRYMLGMLIQTEHSVT